MTDRLEGIRDLYARKERIVMLTAYDYPSAGIAVAGGVDIILVGDSAAMTVLGYTSTREITIDALLVLTKAVRRATDSVPIIGDLPYGSYEASDRLAVESAKRFVDEAGVDAVKLEGAGEMVPRVRAIIAAGIPVFGHVGLLPQSVRTRDGYKARGRDPEQAIGIVSDADDLFAAGVCGLIVEAVPSPVTEIITSRATAPVIGIGAGGAADGQVLVYHDLLGFSDGKLARFVRQYAAARADLASAVNRWVVDVRAGDYPQPEHTYPIAAAALETVQRHVAAKEAI